MKRKHQLQAISCVTFVAMFGLACGNSGTDDQDDQSINPEDAGVAGATPGGASGGGQGGSAGVTTGGAAGTSPAQPEHVEFVDGVEVETLAGSDERGDEDGPAETARFNNPVNVFTAPNGEVFICDFDNSAIRRLGTDGQLDTVFEDARFMRPFGIVLSADGVLFVEADGNTDRDVDTTTGTVWRIDPDTGEGEPIVENVGRPRGLAVAPDGRLVMTDLGRHNVRTLEPESGALKLLAGKDDNPGFKDANGGSARFDQPYGVDWLPTGELVVADFGNHAVRLVSLDGEVTTLAGTGTPGLVDGDLEDAMFSGPKDVAVANDGTIYVTDTGNQRIRRISPEGQVRTVAGDGTAGYNDGLGKEARFYGQEGLDLAEDDTVLIVADGSRGEPQVPYHRVRRTLLSSE